MDKRQFTVIVLCLLILAGALIFSTVSANWRAKDRLDRQGSSRLNVNYD